MSKIRSFSESVCNDIGSKMDPATIVAIIYIVIEIVKYIQSCKKNTGDILPRIRRPGIVDVAIIQMVVRKKMESKTYKKYGKTIVDSIIKKCSDISKQDIDDIFAEVSKNEKF